MTSTGSMLVMKLILFCWTSVTSVGAVYDRAFFLEANKIRAVIDRAYRRLTYVTMKGYGLQVGLILLSAR
jgi:hypothetical protein